MTITLFPENDSDNGWWETRAKEHNIRTVDPPREACSCCFVETHTLADGRTYRRWLTPLLTTRREYKRHDYFVTVFVRRIDDDWFADWYIDDGQWPVPIITVAMHSHEEFSVRGHEYPPYLLSIAQPQNIDELIEKYLSRGENHE